jgi:hypothetical protein
MLKYDKGCEIMDWLKPQQYKDERIKIESLVLASVVYTETLIRLVSTYENA